MKPHETAEGEMQVFLQAEYVSYLLCFLFLTAKAIVILKYLGADVIISA